MNDKVTLQAITDIFAHQYGISRKTTDAFGRSFFDTIVDGLNLDGVVKVAGLGTFKIVEVGSRESVNVTNGERIVIDGYRKVSFVPDELAEQKRSEHTIQLEAEVATAGEKAIEEETKAAEKKLAEKGAEEVSTIVLGMDDPDNVEVPSDEFSGIDMLVSTPESIKEVEKDLMLARVRAERTLEEAKIANIEYRRLELLLDRLKKSSAVEILGRAKNTASVAAVAEPLETPVSVPVKEPETSDESGIETTETVERLVVEGTAEVEASDAMQQSQDTGEEEISPKQNTSEQKHEEALQRYLAHKPEEEVYDDDDDEYAGRRYSKLFIIIPLLGLLIAGIAIFGYRYVKYQVPTNDLDYENFAAHAENTQNKTIEKAPVADEQKDSVETSEDIASGKITDKENKAAKEQEEQKRTEEIKKFEEAKKAEEAKVAAEVVKAKTPKTYVIQKGESLTRISQKFYNTKDSVNAIIRMNKFADPNNVPIGSVIKLP